MEDPLTLQWFDEDFYLLIMRLAINMVFITILIRFLYYEKTRRKDYLFTYYLMNIIINDYIQIHSNILYNKKITA